MIDCIEQKFQSNKHPEKVALWFVRHGQSEGNVLNAECLVMNDTLITPQGIKEADAIAKYLKENNIRVTDIYTSPLGRSHQTAEVVAQELGLPVKVKEGLRERNWGMWGNQTWNNVSSKLDKLTIGGRYTFMPEGGESWQQMEERLFAALEEIAEENESGEDILIVTHRGCLRAMLPILARATKDKHEDFSVETGSLSKFSFSKGGFEFIGLNPSKR